jgi:hypothetical protein
MFAFAAGHASGLKEKARVGLIDLAVSQSQLVQRLVIWPPQQYSDLLDGRYSKYNMSLSYLATMIRRAGAMASESNSAPSNLRQSARP